MGAGRPSADYYSQLEAVEPDSKLGRLLPDTRNGKEVPF